MTHEEILSMLGDYVDYLIANSSAEAPMWNIEKVRSGKPNKWNYIDGCMITACLSLYKTTGDEKYLSFSKNFIDWFVQEDGSIKTYDPKEYNLDNVNQGKNLFTLYDIFGDEKYRKAIETIRSQLATQPRTKEGNFWHKDIYPWQVWLDGTYMAQPFYMEYETRFNKMQGCIDSYKQFMNIKKHMRDEKTGLYYHGYDESRQMYWADPVTGCSPNFWLRAMGWFMVAMVDVLERMDEQLYNEYRGIMAMLKQTIEDVHKFQDEETGMFWQVMDHPGVEGNYLETSGTALFAYAVLKGVRLGYLPKRMAAWAEKAFYGTCDKYLSKNPDGSLQLDGICLVAGLGGKDHRDGSLAYYFSEPVVCNGSIRTSFQSQAPDGTYCRPRQSRWASCAPPGSYNPSAPGSPRGSDRADGVGHPALDQDGVARMHRVFLHPGQHPGNILCVEQRFPPRAGHVRLEAVVDAGALRRSRGGR